MLIFSFPVMFFYIRFLFSFMLYLRDLSYDNLPLFPYIRCFDDYFMCDRCRQQRRFLPEKEIEIELLGAGRTGERGAASTT